MKKPLSFLFLCLFVLYAYRINLQNLIQNSGFETYTNPSVPFSSLECEKAFEGRSSNWYATHGTPQLKGNTVGTGCSSGFVYRNALCAYMYSMAGGPHIVKVFFNL